MKASRPARCLAFAICLFVTVAVHAAPCAPEAPCDSVVVYPESDEPSWIFRQSTYTHDPTTGARVAQYMRTPPVEPLADERLVTSRYRRSRTNLRGTDGSIDSYYEVQAWGNGRGGIDAEWERFHDAWKESYLQGGYYNQQPANGPWGHGGPGYGYGQGYPGYGNGWGGGGGWGGPGWGGPGGGGQFPPNGPGGNGPHHGGGHGGNFGGDD